MTGQNRDAAAAVYVQTNDATANEVLGFERDGDGRGQGRARDCGALGELRPGRALGDRVAGQCASAPPRPAAGGRDSSASEVIARSPRAADSSTSVASSCERA